MKRQMSQPVDDVVSTDFVPRPQQRPGLLPYSSLGGTDASWFQLLTVGVGQSGQKGVGSSLERQIEHELGGK